MHLDACRRDYLEEKAREWDSTIDGLRLTYGSYPIEVVGLLRNWAMFRELITFTFAAFDCGCMSDEVPFVQLQDPHDSVASLEFLQHFIRYYLMDDGCPRLLWWKHGADGVVWATPFEEGADVFLASIQDNPNHNSVQFVAGWDLLEKVLVFKTSADRVNFNRRMEMAGDQGDSPYQPTFHNKVCVLFASLADHLEGK